MGQNIFEESYISNIDEICDIFIVSHQDFEMTP